MEILDLCTRYGALHRMKPRAWEDSTLRRVYPHIHSLYEDYYIYQ